jgi:pimeloyl-ACP methyl ester carboxylesterase
LQPLLFEECYVKSFEEIRIRQQRQVRRGSELEYQGIHLFVMVHGFQGNSNDMRLLKNNIALLFPEVMFLCSSANEEHTEGDIQQMGVRLAQEVNNYITQYCPGCSLGKVSFIAHSLGGIIVRTALPYLEEHREKFSMFMTLSSPHLGYMFNSSTIIDAGMWFLKTWKKSLCLQQLRMSDESKLEDCFMYKLSQSKGLDAFQHIVLVSSYQDSYAPFDSARIQIGSQAKANAGSGSGDVYIKMAENILGNLPQDVLYRIDVDFNISDNNLDSLIGRTAHI